MYRDDLAAQYARADAAERQIKELKAQIASLKGEEDKSFEDLQLGDYIKVLDKLGCVTTIDRIRDFIIVKLYPLLKHYH